MSYRYQIIIIFILGCLSTFGQDIYPDCIHPKTLSFPLSNIIDDIIEDEIYYQPEDQYTYWYRIEVESTGILNYKLSAINTEDDYGILIYNYKGDNFCNDLVQKKENPISNKIEGKLSLKKNEIYYIGILHIKGNGCGHNLFLNTEGKSMTIKAIQNECVEEAIESIVAEDRIKEITPQPIVVVESPLKIDAQINGVVVNRTTKKNIEAIITVIDDKEQILHTIESNVDSGFFLNNTIEKKIIVSINKLGYKPLLDTFNLEANKLIIELTPINIGEKLIMHKIYFHPNTYVLKEESKEELNRLNNFMLENNTYYFEIQGHTNGNRTVKRTEKYAHLGEEWNFSGSAKKLSKLRAEKIKLFLVNNGVEESRLQTVGYGGDKMIIDKPKNMKQAMQNIRVEVIVTQ